MQLFFTLESYRRTYVYAQDSKSNWPTNNALSWQTNSQEVLSVNGILHTARQLRKRKNWGLRCRRLLSPSRRRLAGSIKTNKKNLSTKKRYLMVNAKCFHFVCSMNCEKYMAIHFGFCYWHDVLGKERIRLYAKELRRKLNNQRRENYEGQNS